jgi:chemotaxis signal transduction protein
MEVLPERNIEPIEGSSDWVLGEISWNNQQIPLISIEAAFADKAAKKPKRSRIVIVASISDKNKNKNKYLAIRTTGVPRLIQLGADSIEVKKSKGLNEDFIQFYGLLNHQTVIVPDMGNIEANIVVSQLGTEKQAAADV